MPKFNPLDPLGIFSAKGEAPDESPPAEDPRISQRRQELLAKGHPPGVVNMAMTWARNSADGLAAYHSRDGRNFDTLFEQFLESYLADAEKYINGLMGQPDSV